MKREVLAKEHFNSYMIYELHVSKEGDVVHLPSTGATPTHGGARKWKEHSSTLLHHGDERLSSQRRKSYIRRSGTAFSATSGRLPVEDVSEDESGLRLADESTRGWSG